MTFKFLSIFHNFPGKVIFLQFSMIFHDHGNPDKPTLQIIVSAYHTCHMTTSTNLVQLKAK